MKTIKALVCICENGELKSIEVRKIKTPAPRFLLVKIIRLICKMYLDDEKRKEEFFRLVVTDMLCEIESIEYLGNDPEWSSTADYFDKRLVISLTMKNTDGVTTFIGVI